MATVGSLSPDPALARRPAGEHGLGAPATQLDSRLLQAALSSDNHVAVLILDRELRYQAAFGSALAEHGYHPHALLGRRVPDILAAGAWERVKPRFDAALAGHRVSERFTPGNSRREYEAHYAPAVDEGAVIGVLVTVRDVTTESLARAELGRAQALQELIVDNAADVIATSDAEGRYTWVSPSIQRVIGWQVGQLVGHACCEFIHPDDRRAALAKHDALVTGAVEVTLEYRFSRPDGSWLWVEGRVRTLTPLEGARAGFVATIRDVSERHRLEQQLAQAMEVFELSFAEAPIGEALVAPDGRWLKVNRALCELVGHSEKTLLASTFQDITHPEDRPAGLALQRQVLADEQQTSQLEKRYVRPDGGVVWVLLTTSRAIDALGNVAFFITQMQDITERKENERLLREHAEHDALTGLWNRRRLLSELVRCDADARRYGHRPALLLIDLDGFKAVNDEQGHEAGDAHLREVSQVLREAVRIGDQCARLGGDEFACSSRTPTTMTPLRSPAAS